MKDIKAAMKEKAQATARPTSMTDFMADPVATPVAPSKPSPEPKQGRAPQATAEVSKKPRTPKKIKQESQSEIEKVLLSAPPEDVRLLKTLMESVNCNQSETMRLALRALDAMSVEKRRAMVFDLPRIKTGRKPSA